MHASERVQGKWDKAKAMFVTRRALCGIHPSTVQRSWRTRTALSNGCNTIVAYYRLWEFFPPEISKMMSGASTPCLPAKPLRFENPAIGPIPYTTADMFLLSKSSTANL